MLLVSFLWLPLVNKRNQQRFLHYHTPRFSGRTTWTKRLSKTIQRRSGSFLNTFVPFRKSIEPSNASTTSEKQTSSPHHKRRASAAPAVCLQISTKEAPMVLQERRRNTGTTTDISTTTATTAPTTTCTATTSITSTVGVVANISASKLFHFYSKTLLNQRPWALSEKP